MNFRTVLSMGLAGHVDLDKPLLVRLGLWDPRIVEAECHTSHEGQMLVTLADAGPWLQQVRPNPMEWHTWTTTPSPSEADLLARMGRQGAIGGGFRTVAAASGDQP